MQASCLWHPSKLAATAGEARTSKPSPSSLVKFSTCGLHHVYLDPLNTVTGVSGPRQIARGPAAILLSALVIPRFGSQALPSTCGAPRHRVRVGQHRPANDFASAHSAATGFGSASTAASDFASARPTATGIESAFLLRVGPDRDHNVLSTSSESAACVRHLPPPYRPIAPVPHE